MSKKQKETDNHRIELRSAPRLPDPKQGYRLRNKGALAITRHPNSGCTPSSHTRGKSLASIVELRGAVLAARPIVRLFADGRGTIQVGF